MNDVEHKMLQEAHENSKQVNDFFFKKDFPTRKTRAEQLDDLLGTVRAGKMGTRAILWISGFVISVAALLSALKGWWPK